MLTNRSITGNQEKFEINPIICVYFQSFFNKIPSYKNHTDHPEGSDLDNQTIGSVKKSILTIEYNTDHKVFLIKPVSDNIKMQPRTYKNIKSLIDYIFLLGESWGQIYTTNPLIDLAIIDGNTETIHGDICFIFSESSREPGNNLLLKHFDLDKDMYSTFQKQYTPWIYVNEFGGTSNDVYHICKSQMLEDISAFFDLFP
jgi:hypothetical protein